MSAKYNVTCHRRTECVFLPADHKDNHAEWDSVGQVLKKRLKQEVYDVS